MGVSNVRAMEKGGRFGRFHEEKNVFFLLGSKTARGLISIAAELSRLWSLNSPPLFPSFCSSFIPVLEETKTRVKKLNRP
jgi:hypothetical protein